MYQYFLSYDRLENHLKTIHKNSFKEAEQQIIFPQDHRKATCRRCKSSLYCRGKFQIQKHAWLKHEDIDLKHTHLKSGKIIFAKIISVSNQNTKFTKNPLNI